MRINGFSHLAIAVEDLDASLNFYCDLLGLNLFVRYRYEDFARKEYADGGDGWDGATAKRSFALVHVAPPQPGAYTPFLSITDQPRGERPPQPEFWNWGIHHYGVWVEDFDAVVARLEKAGLRFAAPVIGSDSYNWAMPSGKQIRCMVVRDPDGNLVQFDEVAP